MYYHSHIREDHKGQPQTEQDRLQEEEEVAQGQALKHVGLQIKEVVCLRFEAARQLSITDLKLLIEAEEKEEQERRKAAAEAACQVEAVPAVAE